MFSAIFNVYTFYANCRIDGFMWLHLNKDGTGGIQVELLSPCSGIATYASVTDGRVEFMKNVIDPMNTNCADSILEYLYTSYKSFEDNLPYIKERYYCFLNSQEYEQYCADLETKKDIADMINVQHDLYFNDEIPHLTENIMQLDDELNYYTRRTDDFRLAMIKEITADCNMEIDDELLVNLFDRFFDL